MGAASASKRFNLRGVAPAIVFLVLVFVAGATSTLYHKGAAAAVVTDRNTPPPPPPKILRDGSSGNQQQHRPSPPGNGSPLPRGIVHATTNLEMEASLAGDPEQHSNKPQKEQKRKSLLAVPAGVKNKAVVDKLVTKFPASRLHHMVADYDYVFLWDEDVEVDASDPARYLARGPRGFAAHAGPGLRDPPRAHSPPQGGGGVRRGAGWVEVMVPVFSRAAWRCAWGMLQKVGPGFQARILRGWRPCAVRWREFKEMQIFESRWNAAAAEDESWTDPFAAQPPDFLGD
ncbi:hypothetical protein PR202_gb21148 [Eleusine coracana subsp. coracana]|uniref:Uncharacterized protein n=1 Tax=Eleusine coracana subsp. coracana TaxID=191504 RepID=A0AAV5FDC3_ELECO|nr:hypothetical protein PR202_gb21148 [Eleusine coracana subsp. coracana]